MGFLLKVIFWCGLATLFVSFYGDDMLRFFNNQVRLNGNAVSNKMSSSANIVHSLEIPIQNGGHYWVDMNDKYIYLLLSCLEHLAYIPSRHHIHPVTSTQSHTQSPPKTPHVFIINLHFTL